MSARRLRVEDEGSGVYIVRVTMDDWRAAAVLAIALREDPTPGYALSYAELARTKNRGKHCDLELCLGYVDGGPNPDVGMFGMKDRMRERVELAHQAVAQSPAGLPPSQGNANPSDGNVA